MPDTAARFEAVARRGLRVAAGLIRPETRPTYVRKVRRRLGLTADHAPQGGERCLACGAARPERRTITYAKNADRQCLVRICRRCGHVGNPDNLHDYRKFEKMENLPLRARVGTAERPGREFHMAQMAVDILGRGGLDVCVYGAGRSLDNVHVLALDQVSNVAVSDVMKLRDDAEFIDATGPAPRRFDVVVASEVIEHFLDPQPEFKNLFGYVAANGLLVCSTNVQNGKGLGQSRYPFIPGHTQYYSPRALAALARRNGFHVDFRVPLCATGYAGPRKRYVLFTRSRAVLTRTACYFGERVYAPSEPPKENRERPTTFKQRHDSAS